MSTRPAHIAEAFARHLQRWSLQQHLSPEVAAVIVAAGRLVASRTDEGHVCVSLGEVAATCGLEVAVTRERLRQSRWVGTPSQRGEALLVLDEADRLYLHRYFDYEARLAARLARSLAWPVALPGPAARACLQEQFPDPGTDGGQWQSVAAALALLRRLVVISGGPGTGKTTTVAKLLACLLADAPALRIALAAPTGKAATRLGASLSRTQGLSPAVRARLQAVPMTVHRLLGYGPEGFRYHAGRRLPFDVVVIDEASMLDVSLATRLLEAVPDEARVLLLGDRNQLEAVESGAVFGELCATHALTAPVRSALADLVGLPLDAIDAPAAAGDPLADAVIWFSRNYRFKADSAIGQLAVAVQSGEEATALALLEAQASSLRWLESASGRPTGAQLEALRAGYQGYYDCLSDEGTTPSQALQSFDAYRVLAATREGPWGVSPLNAWLARPMREQRGGTGAWYRGRPVLITRNDPSAGLYNGDVGIAMEDADGILRVWFDAGAGSPRAFAPSQLPPHETAFAMTIHKSQGSEFAAVAVVLPPAPSAILSRELLYTGITRARSDVTLVGSRASVETAIRRPGTRVSGLRDRLHAALNDVAGHLSP